VKIAYSHNCCSLVIISSTKVYDYYFASLFCEKNAEGVLRQRVLQQRHKLWH